MELHSSVLLVATLATMTQLQPARGMHQPFFMVDSLFLSTSVSKHGPNTFGSCSGNEFPEQEKYRYTVRNARCICVYTCSG